MWFRQKKSRIRAKTISIIIVVYDKIIRVMLRWLNKISFCLAVSLGLFMMSVRFPIKVSALFSSEEDIVVKIITKDKCYDIFYGDARIVYGDALYYDCEKLAQKIASECYKEAENAHYVYFDGSLSVKEGILGEKIDEEKLIADIRSSLSSGGGTVTARYIDVKPRYYKKDLEKNVFLRAEFFTTFSGSKEGRANNIKLAVKKLGDVTLYPEQVLSFNDSVGKRDLESGFLSAKVIIGGKYVDGVGGGVCQVSTTLYNAALLSGLEVVEQHRHTLAVSYVEKSFDAMVSYGYADLKIKNPYSFPVFIRGETIGNKLIFKIFGARQTETVERESVVTKIIEPEMQTVATDKLASNEKRVVVFPKYGYESEGYLIITSDGVKTRRFLRKDEYKKVDGITEVGI